MTPDRRLLAGAFAVAILVAACGGSAAATPATPAATDNSAGNPTPAATENGSGQTPGTTDAPISLTPGNATALEAMIPDKVGSATITKTSFDYSSIPWSSLSGAFGNGDINTILTANGKTLADVKFAMGISTTAGAGGLPTMVYALQVSGLDASKFVSQLDTSYASGTDLTVGGKSVKGSITGGYGTVTYLHNDVAFIALGSEADLNTLIAALP